MSEENKKTLQRQPNIAYQMPTCSKQKPCLCSLVSHEEKEYCGSVYFPGGISPEISRLGINVEAENLTDDITD